MPDQLKKDSTDPYYWNRVHREVQRKLIDTERKILGIERIKFLLRDEFLRDAALDKDDRWYSKRINSTSRWSIQIMENYIKWLNDVKIPSQRGERIAKELGLSDDEETKRIISADDPFFYPSMSIVLNSTNGIEPIFQTEFKRRIKLYGTGMDRE